MNSQHKNYDVIIIGAGHNGLVNACYLQKAGLNVLVLEKNDWIGGAAVSRELLLIFYIPIALMFVAYLGQKLCATWNCLNMAFK